MAEIPISFGGGSGSGSDDCTATSAYVLWPYTAITKDSNDEPAVGAMPNFAGQKNQCKNIWWNKDGDGNLAIAVDYGFHASNWDNGSYEYIAGQELRNAIGATDSARLLAGTTIAGLAGTMPNRGNLERWIGVNETHWLEPGYYSGGYVSQNIAVRGGEWITPAPWQQVVNTAWHYCTDNIVINPIPNNYIDINQSQTVFDNGSYGLVANLGAFQLRDSGNWQAASLSDNCLYLPTSSLDGYRGRIIWFRRYIDFSPFSKIRVTYRTVVNNTEVVISGMSHYGTGATKLFESIPGISETERTFDINIPDAAKRTGVLRISSYNYSTAGGVYVRNITLIK